MIIFKSLSLFYIYLPIICSNNLTRCTESSSESTNESTSEFEDQLITVDIKNRFNTQGVQYTYNQFHDSHTFTPNQGYLIDKVTKRGTVLWDAKNYGNVYGSKVFVGVGDGGNRVFRVYFPGPLQPEHLEPPKLLEPETGKPRLVTLDIRNKKSTQVVKYKYDEKHSTHIFTPNKGYLIDKVTKRGTVLWDAKNYGNVYGSKVFVGVGDGGNRVFRVYFPGPLQPEHLEPPKLLEPETGKPRLVTLDIRNKKSTQVVKYKYDEKHSTHIFTPNKGYLIHDVMRKGKLMWVCENGVYPEKVLIFPDKKGELILRFKFPKVDDTPEEPFETDHRLIDLDLDNTRPNPMYSITYTGFDGEYGIIYEAKSVYKFKSIIDGTKMVWCAMGKDDCAYKVTFVYNPYLEQQLRLFFPDGRIKTLINSFLPFTFGNWKEY